MITVIRLKLTIKSKRIIRGLSEVCLEIGVNKDTFEVLENSEYVLHFTFTYEFSVAWDSGSK